MFFTYNQGLSLEVSLVFLQAETQKSQIRLWRRFAARFTYLNSQPYVETLRLLSAPNPSWSTSWKGLRMRLHGPLRRLWRALPANAPHQIATQGFSLELV